MRTMNLASNEDNPYHQSGDTPHCDTHVDLPADYTLRGVIYHVMIDGIDFYAFGEQWFASPLLGDLKRTLRPALQ